MQQEVWGSGQEGTPITQELWGSSAENMEVVDPGPHFLLSPPADSDMGCVAQVWQ